MNESGGRAIIAPFGSVDGPKNSTAYMPQPVFVVDKEASPLELLKRSVSEIQREIEYHDAAVIEEKRRAVKHEEAGARLRSQLTMFVEAINQLEESK